MSGNTAHLPAVGARILLSGHFGTIRFVGAVEGTQGIWLGVEWDDPARGKHDGVKDSRRYFTCRVPNSGSFIRPTAVGISYGTSFLKALFSKYTEAFHGAGIEKVVLGSSNGAIEVEAVGLDKIRSKLSNLRWLREVSLDDQGVASADPNGVIQRTCPSIRGLDLSKSLLPSWDVVTFIVSELPALETLALNDNRLAMPSFSTPRFSEAFSKIKELQISSTLTRWSETMHLVSCMPSLCILETGYNRLERLAITDGAPQTHAEHSTLRAINFDDEKTRSSLQRLILSSNSLTMIDERPDRQSSGIGHLKYLSLTANSLTDWRDIDRLYSWCPSIESLSVTGNPLLQDTHARQFTVAKIPSLAVLDGAAISPKERLDCELFYLSYVAKYGPDDEAERCEAHPRWRELCAKHTFQDTPRLAGQGKHDTLGNRLFGIVAHQCAHPPSGTNIDATQTQTLKVLPSMSMRTFRMKIAKSFRLDKAEQPRLRIWLRMTDGTFSELDVAEDTHDLAWWGLEDSSEIILVTCKS